MRRKSPGWVNFSALVVPALVVLQLVQCGVRQDKLASQQLNSEQRQLVSALKDVTKNYLVEKV